MKKGIFLAVSILVLMVFAGSVLAVTEGNSYTFYGTGAVNSPAGDDDYDTFIWA